MTIRPQTLDDYIGQEQIKQRLRVSLVSTKVRNEPLPHTILYGPPGLGKTSLAAVIANELQVGFHPTNATAISSVDDLIPILQAIHEGDVLFIDEIHRLMMPVEESLYEVMEDFILSIRDFGRAWVPKFTLIGATTILGNLSKPLRDRFGLSFNLKPYTLKEISHMILSKAFQMGIDIDTGAAVRIGMRSRGVARIACHHLDRCHDMAIYTNSPKIDVKVVEETFKLLNIDENGLGEEDYKYLAVLASSDRPKGLSVIASAMNDAESSISEMIEPYLIQSGLVERTPRGRVITELGIELLNKKRS